MSWSDDDNEWSNYLNFTVDELLARAKKSGTSHKGTTGGNREKVLEDFLSSHLSKRLHTMRGLIRDSQGAISRQMDITVVNDLTPDFSTEMNVYASVESVVGSISVKSYLNKNELYNSLLNLASIPQLGSNCLTINPIVSYLDGVGIQKSKEELFACFTYYYPCCFIFAYDGIELKTIMQHLDSFYKEHPEINENRYPIRIIVLGKYMISYYKNDEMTVVGTVIEKGVFRGYKTEGNIRGLPLAHMLHELSVYLEWMPYLTINVKDYFNRGLSTELIETHTLRVKPKLE